MTQPLIDRLNLLIKQLLYLNEILAKNTEYLPEALRPDYDRQLAIEISNIKELIKKLHHEINQAMSRCYKQQLEIVENICNVESKFYLLNKKENQDN